MAKTRTLTVSFPHPNPADATGKNPRYRVERVTDATDPSPGDYLIRSEVNVLCESKTWKVTILPHEES
jgi:hypothetical protein